MAERQKEGVDVQNPGTLPHEVGQGQEEEHRAGKASMEVDEARRWGVDPAACLKCLRQPGQWEARLDDERSERVPGKQSLFQNG